MLALGTVNTFFGAAGCWISQEGLFGISKQQSMHVHMLEGRNRNSMMKSTPCQGWNREHLFRILRNTIYFIY